MIRERHYLTHRAEGKYSIGIRLGRAGSRGEAISEMDFHAMYLSGLLGCVQELLERGNSSIVLVYRDYRRVDRPYEYRVNS
jgi:hypothetical protein